MSNLCVPDLVHNLCEGLLKDLKRADINSTEIRHYKKLAFEILLKKASPIGPAETQDTLDELEFTKFELKFNTKSDEEGIEIDESLKIFIELFKTNQESLNDISALLLKLKNSNCCKDVQV